MMAGGLVVGDAGLRRPGQGRLLTMRMQDLILGSIAKACVSKDEATNRKR
jgi:hypothetical protein